MKLFGLIFNGIKYSDKVLWAIIILISVYSLMFVKSVSRETFNYFTVQFACVVMGFLAVCILQTLNYKILLRLWKYIAAVSVILVLCTFFAGVRIEGSMGINARAWIRLPGGITFQPSEFMKIGFIITFSKHIYEVKKRDKLNGMGQVALLGLHISVPVLLTHFQGDDGAAVIFLCMAFIMLFMAGLKFRFFGMIILGVLATAPLLWKFVLADYQKKRILTQFNPEVDPLNMGYQQIQSKLSIGSGGIFGHGIFNGPRVANNVVPIQESDFIFSAVGEELGFIGCVVLLILVFSLVARVGTVARNCGESAGALICFGFMGLIASQTVFNLGMCLSILPVMGVTLPFFSVGGSSVICLYLGLGIIQSIYINRDQTKKTLNTENAYTI